MGLIDMQVTTRGEGTGGLSAAILFIQGRPGNPNTATIDAG